MNNRELLDRKKAPKFAAAALAAVALLGACSNSSPESTPETAPIGASPSTTPEASVTASPAESATPSSDNSVSASTTETAASQTLDTNYDEALILEEIKTSRSVDVELAVAALEIAKNPEYAIQLGASEVWWQAQIDIASAYIDADNEIRTLDDQDSLGHDFTMGFLSKAMLPMYASGLEMAKEYNIPMLTENTQPNITINGLDGVGLGNLGLDTWVQSAAESKSLARCVETFWEFDESIYNPNDPQFAGKDERVIEILKKQDNKIHTIIENYLVAIDAHC